MNNEPVAWMQTYKGEPNNIAWTKKDLEELGQSIEYGYVPLYTAPKELTDEEIFDCVRCHDIHGNDAVILEFVNDLLGRARAK